MHLSFALLALFASLGFTAAYLPVARRLKIMDAPNHRSAHRVLTPSSGGVAVVAAIVISVLATQWFTGAMLNTFPLTLQILLFATCALGAVDDRRPLPVYLRLAAFLLFSAVAVFVYVDAEFAPVWVWSVSVLGFAWLLNLYNFMDGIDGLAALQAVLVAGGMFVVSYISGAEPGYSMLCAIIAGAYLGFLVFNWPPAKLFMGDAGSLSAGFLVGCLGLWAWHDARLLFCAWCLLMSPFLLDTGVTLAARAMRGERLSEAHSGHCYQRLARRFGSHRRVDLCLLALHLFWLLPLAILSVFGFLPQWTLVFLGLFPQLLLIAKLRRLQ